MTLTVECMVIVMNKEGFIKELQNRINYSEKDCLTINDILEHHFFISKRNKDVIIEELCNTFKINIEEAEHIYTTCKDILNEEIKYKLKHPFGSQK